MSLSEGRYIGSMTTEPVLSDSSFRSIPSIFPQIFAIFGHGCVRPPEARAIRAAPARLGTRWFYDSSPRMGRLRFRKAVPGRAPTCEGLSAVVRKIDRDQPTGSSRSSAARSSRTCGKYITHGEIDRQDRGRARLDPLAADRDPRVSLRQQELAEGVGQGPGDVGTADRPGQRRRGGTGLGRRCARPATSSRSS